MRPAIIKILFNELFYSSRYIVRIFFVEEEYDICVEMCYRFNLQFNLY